MKILEKQSVANRVILYEIIAFASIILLVWLDEVMDIPALFLGAVPTPINWRESLFESVFIVLIGAVIIHFTHSLLKRMKYLEGILPVCASCKKIRDEQDHWHPIESYVRERSDVEFSHGICPECAEKLYPEFNPYEKEEK
ncbi:hypothetical protein KKD52_06805 [Myxococcota bacterium]|nr:hypothetical protein [Myxococcota bacterium]MBU1413351.1 hypothetical protein [Myxococcota bacterium]MBU1510054.1 hypothetical protein [Myxococcota bacterium]